jgi:hypothetical protein
MNKMAIVRATSYTRSRGAAKATIRYITHHPGNDGLRKTRQISGIDGAVNKEQAYQMIDEARIPPAETGAQSGLSAEIKAS